MSHSIPHGGVTSPTSSMTSPLSPRSSVPSYVRRSSAATTVLGGPSSSRSSTLPSTPSSTSQTTYFGGSSSSGNVVDLLDRPRDRTRNSEVSASALAFLYAEVVSYTQGRVTGIADLERKLSLLGYRIGQRAVPLLSHRLEFPTPPSLSSGSATYNRQPKRETRLLPVLLWLHTQLWKALFGKPADSLERSTERNDEFMISTNSPLFSKSMSVPKEMNQLCVEAITAGIVEAALDGLGFPSRVTAHGVSTPEQPLRVTILVKLNKEVMEREEALGPA